MHVGHRVNPLGGTADVPELPEEAAHQRSQGKADRQRPVAPRHRTQDRGLTAQNGQPKHEDQRREPEQREEQIGPYAQADQARRGQPQQPDRCPARVAQTQGRTMQRAVIQARQRSQQVGCAQHRGQHRGERQGGHEKIGERTQFHNGRVVPVLREAVEIFKEPPEERTHGKEPQEQSRPRGHQAASRTPYRQAVDHHDVAQPERGKNSDLVGREPCHAAPRQPPRETDEGHAAPPPGGKPGRHALAFNRAGAKQAQRDSPACQQGKEGQCPEERPREGGMLNVVCQWRKRQAGPDRTPGQPQPHQRQPPHRRHHGHQQNHSPAKPSVLQSLHIEHSLLSRPVLKLGPGSVRHRHSGRGGFGRHSGLRRGQHIV